MKRAVIVRQIGFTYVAERFSTAARYADRKAEILEKIEVLGCV